MEHNIEISQSGITFLNEPKLSLHEVDQKFNERRISLVHDIKDYISTSTLFKDKQTSITFVEKGVSSLVSIIETDGKKMVLKIPLSLTNSFGEAQFLKVWEQAGVRVPHVIDEGFIGGAPYCLMEYIDAPTLNTIPNRDEASKEKMNFEMGQTLRKMHSPEASGYGRVIDNKAEYTQFKEWLMSEDRQKIINYVQENNLLSEEHGSISLAIEILLSYVGDNDKSSYCHDDYGGANIFATHPITVFDPNPRFNNGYIDLGRTLVLHISNKVFPQQLLDGYFEDGSCDKKVLHASVLLNSYLKFSYWNKTKKVENMQNIREHLIKNKNLLE